MLKVTEKLTIPHPKGGSVLSLPFDLRQRSRLRCVDTNGRELGLVLSRGGVLRHGDQLRAENGEIITIEAALERVSSVKSANAFDLSRAAYHLGNRHIPLEIQPGRLAYLHDHVLDDMVRTLGFEVHVEEARFEPEPGAYGGHTHAHGTDHHHDHDHADHDHHHP